MDEEISPVSLPTDIAALVDAINKLPEDVRVEAGIDEVLPRAVEGLTAGFLE